MTSRKRVAVYGAGGFAREVAWLLSQQSEFVDLVGFIDDSKDRLPELNRLQVFSFDDFLAKEGRQCSVVIGIGEPNVRENVAIKCHEANLRFFSAVHHSVESGPVVTYNHGTIICAGSIITTNVVIGQHVHINLDCTIGHDVVIDDYATLAPGVHVSGNVRIGRRAYIGTGANIIHGSPNEPLVIADDCIIAAGACVTKSTDGRGMYAGVPAVLKKMVSAVTG